MPNSIISNLTALTAARDDQIPVNRAGVDGYVTVAGINAADTDYVDIRDYGTVASGGNITTALQGALDAVNSGAVTQKRVRVPMVGTGIYTVDALTFPTFDAFILELDCVQITTSATWTLDQNRAGATIMGMQNATNSNLTPYGPNPRPRLNGASGVDPVISVRANNVWIEGISVSANGGIGVKVFACALITIKRCMISTNSTSSTGNLPALKFDSVFWAQLQNIFLEPGIHSDGSAAGYSCEFTTDTNYGPNNGIMLCRDWIVHRNGILFRAHYGPVGVDHTEMIDIHSENQCDGTSLITFDSNQSIVGNIYLKRISVSDPGGFSGGVTTYLIKNTGSRTRGIYLENANNILTLDPTSDGIKEFVLDNTCRTASSNRMGISLAKQFAGSDSSWGNWSTRTPGWIDAKLGCAPIGLPWVPYTPLAIVQDPASWTAVGGSTITTGELAPDGSTMAATVADGSGCRFYDNGSHTLATGDYILAGVWMRNPGDILERNSLSGIEILGATSSGGSLFSGIEDQIIDNGWRWCMTVCKIGTVTTTPSRIRFRISTGSGISMQLFAPCATLIPAATVAELDEVWIVNLARSMKGGWPSGAAQGDVALLDHQKFKLGGGARIFSSSALPTTGTGAVGDISFNSAPAPGEPLGWVCIGAGSPGTWMGLASITDAALTLSATGTGTGAFVGTSVLGVGQALLSATGSVAATFSSSQGTGALSFLNAETQGFAIDGTTDGGTVAVIDTTTPANDLLNVALDASNLVQSATSTKTVLWNDSKIRLVPSGGVAQEYDAALGQFGILIEPAATNELTQSEDLDDTSVWGASTVTVTADVGVAGPNGSSAPDEIFETAANSSHSLSRDTLSPQSGTAYTTSIYAKADTSNWMQIAMDTGSWGAAAWGNFDLSNGVVGNKGASATTSIQSIGNGWYRCILTATATVTGVGNQGPRFGFTNNTDTGSRLPSYVGSVLTGMYLWGAQYETGSIATSYIPTGAVAVSREADAISVDTSTFPWSDTTGTIYLDYKPKAVTSGTRYAWAVQVDANNQISLFGSTANPTMGNVTASSTDVATDLGTLVANTRTQITVGYGANDFDGSQDGAAATADSTATLTTGYTTLYIGATGTTGSELHGYIYRLIYVPRHVETEGNNIETWRLNF
jgi:hypothetical protein